MEGLSSIVAQVFGTAEEIKETKERCDLILKCKHEIDYWKSKLTVLEDEQATCIKLARLRIDAVSTWRSLSRAERMDKKYILAALEAPELPRALIEFPSCSFPPHVRMDRDILLARVKRDDFGESFSASCQTPQCESRDRNFFVPPRLRSDKEVTLAVLRKYPQVIEWMSGELRDDDSILFELLKQHPGNTLPRNFIQQFSDRIRSTPNILLQVFQHPLGLTALGYCSQELRNDKSFILQAIHQTKEIHGRGCRFQILRFVSQRLRADPEVVELAVEQSGLNLKHACYQWRRDREIVLQACAQNGAAFRYCLPGSVKEELFQDESFLFEVVKFCPNYVIKNCEPHFLTNRKLLLEAAIHGLDLDLLPETYQSDTDFVREMILASPRRYMDLPLTTNKEMLETALAVFLGNNPSDDVMLEATECCPLLLQNREAMWAIASKKGTEIIMDTLAFASKEIRSDKELMLRAIQTDQDAFEYCSENLQEDLEIIFEALPNSLCMAPIELQLEHPNLVVQAIEKTPLNDIWMTHDDINESLWRNRDVAKAWLSKGGDWLADQFPDEFESDEELLLLVARNRWSEFFYASEDLKNNKKFMLQAVAVDGRVIREVSEDLRYDYELVLAAFGHNIRAIQYYSSASDFEFIVGFAQWVRNQIDDFMNFSNEIVTNMSRLPTSKCPLGLLNQGPVLLDHYRKTLASFLGLPTEKDCEVLQAVSKNLLAWGI